MLARTVFELEEYSRNVLRAEYWFPCRPIPLYARHTNWKISTGAPHVWPPMTCDEPGSPTLSVISHTPTCRKIKSIQSQVVLEIDPYKIVIKFFWVTTAITFSEQSFWLTSITSTDDYGGNMFSSRRCLVAVFNCDQYFWEILANLHDWSPKFVSIHFFIYIATPLALLAASILSLFLHYVRTVTVSNNSMANICGIMALTSSWFRPIMPFLRALTKPLVLSEAFGPLSSATRRFTSFAVQSSALTPL